MLLAVFWYPTSLVPGPGWLGAAVDSAHPIDIVTIYLGRWRIGFRIKRIEPRAARFVPPADGLGRNLALRDQIANALLEGHIVGIVQVSRDGRYTG
jgi:hypothetical protein